MFIAKCTVGQVASRIVAIRFVPDNPIECRSMPCCSLHRRHFQGAPCLQNSVFVGNFDKTDLTLARGKLPRNVVLVLGRSSTTGIKTHRRAIQFRKLTAGNLQKNMIRDLEQYVEFPKRLVGEWFNPHLTTRSRVVNNR
jgi:hypothetical protein